jgi:FkbM family methyltransferase
MIALETLANAVMLRLSNLRNACVRIGFINTLLYIFKTKIIKRMYSMILRKSGRYKMGTLSSKELRVPVVFRYNSSDTNVFSQLFIVDEYRPLTDLRDVKLIVDCGAYVGFSSAYMLSRFPEASVLAVEPDPKNYELLKQNLSPYQERATTINAAVWSRKVGLKLRSGHPGEESEWVTTVRECRQGEPADLQAVDIETLLRLSNRDEIDIIKMDIEGAEAMVFSENFEPWIKKVRAFAIELHNEECSKAFYRALGSGSFRFSHSGEIAIARRHGC